MEPTDSRRPFRALLDVGLVRTTTGNRVFGALKVLLAIPFKDELQDPSFFFYLQYFLYGLMSSFIYYF